MLKYIYKPESGYDLILNNKIQKYIDLAESFFIIVNAIYIVYDVYQNPAAYQHLFEPTSPDLVNNFKYKNIILSNFKRENILSSSNFPECFSDIEYYLRKILYLTGLTGIEDQIILFICLKPYFFFKNTLDVLTDQKGVLNGEFRDCDFYYVCLYENNNLVISIFIFLFPQYNQQAHFYIVKDLNYSLKKFIDGLPKLKIPRYYYIVLLPIFLILTNFLLIHWRQW